MKNKLITICLLAAFSSPLFAQSNNVVERGFACNIKDGFTINDVVGVMKGFDWSEDVSPGVAILREPLAVSGDFQNDWDFVVAFYYPSYADMVEKRTAFRSRTGGTEGYRLRDVADCGDRIRINNVWFALESSGGPIPEVAPSMALNCELNGLSLSQAISNAGNIRNFLGPEVRQAFVINRMFGGPSMPQNSQVGYRAIFNSSDGFAEAVDRITDNIQPPNPDNPQTCNVGSLWADHLIFARDN